MKSAKCISKTNRTWAHYGAWQILVMVQQVHHRVTLCRLCRKDLPFEICDLASFSASVCHQQNQQRIYMYLYYWNHAPAPRKTQLQRLLNQNQISSGSKTTSNSYRSGLGLRLLRQTIYFCQIQTWNFPYIMSAQKPSGTQRSVGAWGVILPFLPANFIEVPHEDQSLEEPFQVC